MSEYESFGWPAFELATLQVAPSLPSGAQVLATRAVPKRIIGHEFIVLSEARPVAVGSVQNLIAFGSSGLRGMVCLNLVDGAVVCVTNVDGSQINPVNTSLDKFTECVAAMIGRFPFYRDDDEFERWESVADELAETLGSIDEATGAHNSFWVTFVDDVRIGDYATSMIVN